MGSSFLFRVSHGALALGGPLSLNSYHGPLIHSLQALKYTRIEWTALKLDLRGFQGFKLLTRKGLKLKNLKLQPSAKNCDFLLYECLFSFGLGCRPFRLQLTCPCSADTAMYPNVTL